MTALLLSRWQFLFTATFKYSITISVTLGLSLFIAIIETLYVRTGQEVYKKMAQFWGRIFVIFFVTGVVTGLVLEFQLGMNWSEYSRFMGDIFGVPLAMEALSSFFLESVFLGIWIFGWDKLSKGIHLAAIWLVALGANLSAYWILTVNSFMQVPVGYTLRHGRAELTDILTLLSNPNIFYQYPHTVLSGYVTVAFLVMGISAYHLLKNNHLDFFRRSFHIGLLFAFIGILISIFSGHYYGRFLVNSQPSTMAATEALWESADPAPFTLFALIDEKEQRNSFAIKVPYLASLLAYHRFGGEIKGIKEVQTETETRYGPGDYIPSVNFLFWSFRLMVLGGFWLLFLSSYSLYLWKKRMLEKKPWVLRAILWSIPVTYLSTVTGWFMTEAGRQPWTIYGLQKVEEALSPPVSAGVVFFSFIGYFLIYILLMVLLYYMVTKIAKKGPVEEKIEAKEEEVWPWT